MTLGGREFPERRLHDPEHAFTVFINGRKRDKLFLLRRASFPPPKELAANKMFPRTSNPAESKGSLSPMRFGFRRVLFCRACFPISGGESTYVHLTH